MKATGIVRRIDDLGRVVIPRDIRKNMGIREGDPLEIYTDRDGCVMFKKYSPNNTDEVVTYLVHTARVLGFDISVYDDLGAYVRNFFKKVLKILLINSSSCVII